MQKIDELHESIRVKWISLIEDANGDPPANIAIWEDTLDIISVLQPFLGPSQAHGHLPTGGGLDFHNVNLTEDGCIDLNAGGRTGYIVRPKRLIVCYVPSSPGESFVLLELGELKAVGRDGEVDPTDVERGREELVELYHGRFVDRSCWDEQEIENEDGDNVPLPDTARVVVRFLRGKILFVAKGSLWNGAATTYDGRHTHMTAEQIRSIIEGTVKMMGG